MVDFRKGSTVSKAPKSATKKKRTRRKGTQIDVEYIQDSNSFKFTFGNNEIVIPNRIIYFMFMKWGEVVDLYSLPWDDETKRGNPNHEPFTKRELARKLNLEERMELYEDSWSPLKPNVS